MVNAMQQFMKFYHEKGTSQRVGQFFVNNFIEKEDETTKSMFHETDREYALFLINQWLINNQHTETLPPITTEVGSIAHLTADDQEVYDQLRKSGSGFCHYHAEDGDTVWFAKGAHRNFVVRGDKRGDGSWDYSYVPYVGY